MKKDIMQEIFEKIYDSDHKIYLYEFPGIFALTDDERAYYVLQETGYNVVTERYRAKNEQIPIMVSQSISSKYPVLRDKNVLGCEIKNSEVIIKDTWNSAIGVSYTLDERVSDNLRNVAKLAVFFEGKIDKKFANNIIEHIYTEVGEVSSNGMPIPELQRVANYKMWLVEDGRYTSIDSTDLGPMPTKQDSLKEVDDVIRCLHQLEDYSM